MCYLIGLHEHHDLALTLEHNLNDDASADLASKTELDYLKALMLKDEIPSYDKEAMDTEHDKEDVKEEDTAITHQDHDIAHQDIAVMSQDEMSEDEKGEKQKLLDVSSGK